MLIGRTPNAAMPQQRSSSLQDGLAAVYVPRGGTMVAFSNWKQSGTRPAQNNKIMTPNNSPTVARLTTPRGNFEGVTFNGSTQWIGGASGVDSPFITQVDEVTIMTFVVPLGTANLDDCIAFIANASTSVQSLGFYQSASSANQVGFYAQDSSSTQNPNATHAQWTNGNPVVLVGRRSKVKNFHQTFFNGMPSSANTTFTALGGTFDTANNVMAFGAFRGSSVAAFWNGSIFIHAIWERAISDAEVALVSANPYAVLGAGLSPNQNAVGSIANAYVLTADAGSYALTGVAAATRAARVLTAAAGSYNLTGVAAGLVRARTLTAVSGSYSLTGVAAGLRAARTIAAAAGAYNLTGVAAGLKSGRTLACSAGAYALTGVAAGLAAARRITAAAGAYNLTGVAATLNYSGSGSKTLTADAGTYALTGVAAGVRAARRLVAAQGSYALSGVAAGTIAARRITAVPGAYSLSGNAAGLAAARKLAAATGAYNLTGVAAGVIAGRKIVAAPGAYALTGVAAGFLRTRLLAAGPGAYLITGNDATLVRSAVSLGTPAPYWNIKQAIQSAIRTALPSVAVSIDQPIHYAESWVGIFTDDRTADADAQWQSDGSRTRFEISHRIEIWRYALGTAKAAELRNALLGDVELALMLDRTLGNVCETSWIDGGRFLAVADPNLRGAFWGGAEINLKVVASALV